VCGVGRQTRSFDPQRHSPWQTRAPSSLQTVGRRPRRAGPAAVTRWGRSSVAADSLHLATTRRNATSSQLFLVLRRVHCDVKMSRTTDRQSDTAAARAVYVTQLTTLHKHIYTSCRNLLFSDQISSPSTNFPGRIHPTTQITSTFMLLILCCSVFHVSLPSTFCLL